MINKLIAVSLCLALAFAALAIVDPGSSVEGKESAGNTVSYTVREPFRIDSDADFPAYANGGGDGSAGNPWVMENYEINGTGYGYGIYIGNTTEYFVVRDCLLHNTSGYYEWPYFMNAGITLNLIRNGLVQNNTARECAYGFIMLEYEGVEFKDNLAFNNSEDGIRLWSSSYSIVHNNTANNNGNSGIAVLSSNNNMISNNTANNNIMAGIQLSSIYSWGDSQTNQIMNNSASGNHYGLYMGHSYWSDVRNNMLSDNHVGICVFTSENNKFFDNNVTNNSMGIIMDSSTNNYLGGNSILNSTGMTGSSSHHSFETALDVFQNDPDWSAYSSFEEQLATGGGGNSLFTKAIDLADTVLFEVSISGHANSPDLDLGIFLDGKGGNDIDGITQAGEIVAYSADSTAEESIRLLAPEDGAYLIRVFGYTVNANPGQFDMEINIVNATSTGIYMTNSTSNNVVNNNISHNSRGLNLTSGSDFNRFHYNNIADNGVQAFDDGVNFWNTSYPDGGNFWSDYAGADSFSGPGQDVPGSDGIGDTPYTNILGGGNQDAYPLMNYTDDVYIDTAPPVSSAYIEVDEPFWGYCIVSAHAYDDYSGIHRVALWYRYSPDNQTWGNWAEFTFYDPGEPSWFFAPVIQNEEEGYYEFYTIATDHAGNVETKPQVAEAYWLFDVTAPQSRVLQPATYWNVPDLDMEVHVADNTNSTNNVEVFYRFSPDNATWGGWSLYENLTSEPWNFTFDFPDGQGQYQLYSRANDTSGNPENATAAAQARVGYDITAPEITDSSPTTGTTGDAYTFLAQVTDNVALGEVHVVYRFGTGTEANATMTHTGTGNYELGITIPGSSLDMLHYRIVAVDEAKNWNSTGTGNVLVTDNDAPVANAGPDQAVDAGTVVTFNGSASTDNIGIVNFTWAFNDGMGNITLYGVSPTHNFTVSGNYTITLTVRDAAGNTATDTMVLRVSALPPDVDTTPPVADAGPDRAVTAGALVTFDGSASIDNVGIDNYTWTFTHNGTAITLYGVSPAFRFWETGNHTATLNVTDAAGNWATDTMRVSVAGPDGGEEDDDDAGGGNLWIIIIVIVAVLALVAFMLMGKGKAPAPVDGEPGPEETEPEPVEPASEEPIPSTEEPPAPPPENSRIAS